MGVPKLFGYLARRYKDKPDVLRRIGNRKPFDYEQLIGIIQSLFAGRNMPGIHSLAIDMNSLFHNAYTLALRQNQLRMNESGYTPISHLDAVVREIEAAVKAFKPSQAVILAVDGVPSVAKMQEQQRRRVGGALTGTKYGLLVPSPTAPLTQEFNKSVLLTPGTYYMDALEAGINHWIDQTFTDQNPISPKFVVYMGHREPGEGEHKILQLYRSRKLIEDPTQGVHVMYGADADLIFLGMMLYLQLGMSMIIARDNFRTDRKTNKIITHDERFVSLSVVQTDMLATDLEQHQIPPQDFIFMTMLMGNDFVPGVIEGRNFGTFMNLMIEVYSQNMADDHLINDRGDLEWKNILKFLRLLTAQSGQFLKDLVHPDQVRNYVNKQNPLLQYINDPIKFRAMYYNRCSRSPWTTVPPEYQALLDSMSMSSYFTPQPEVVSDQAHHYFAIWKWAFDLYWGRSLSNTYAYPHWYPPMIVDLAQYLELMIDVKTDDDEPIINNLINETLIQAGFMDIHPVHELFAVLPDSAKYLIPPEIMSDPKVSDLWARTRITNFRTDDYLATADYLTKLLLPPIPIRLIVGTINKSLLITDPVIINKQNQIAAAVVRKAEREGNMVFQKNLNYRYITADNRRKYLTAESHQIIRLRMGTTMPLVDINTPLYNRNTRLDPILRKNLSRARDVDRILRQQQRAKNPIPKLPGTIVRAAKGNSKTIDLTKIPLAPQTLKHPWSERHKHLPTLKLK